MSITLAAEFGLRDDGKAWITIKAKDTEEATFIWPGGVKRAGAVAQAINSLAMAKSAMKAAVGECRDQDSDACLSSKTADQLQAALLAMGARA